MLAGMPLPHDVDRTLGGVLVAIFLLSGCPGPDATVCGRVICPVGTVCDQLGSEDLCLEPGQREACIGKIPGDTCNADGESLRTCSDQSVCVTGGYCGNGRLEDGEVCDGSALADGADCTSVDGQVYYSGSPACALDCSALTLGTCAGRCGDGVVQADEGEQCDGANVPATCATADPERAYYEGSVTCTAQCAFDTAACSGFCGDDTINGPEVCDGGRLGGNSCQTLGFQTGNLTCAAGCGGFDQTGCSGVCGDGSLDPGEVCDGAQLLEGLSCKAFGYYSDDGLVCGTETTSLEGAAACLTVAPEFDDVAGACTGFCGDGVVDEVELCDGDALAPGVDCRDLGYYSGVPGCAQAVPSEAPSPQSGCTTLAEGNCKGYCGDGQVNGFEVCDGLDFGGLGCTNFGFYDGDLSCVGNAPSDEPSTFNNCGTISAAGCTGYCGDGVLDPGEQCDGPHHAQGATCTTLGGDAGALGCNGLCQPTESLCFTAGLSTMASPTLTSINDVSAATADNVWGVGSAGLILHYDGEVWAEISPVGVASPTKSLNAVSAYGSKSDSRIWIVGQQSMVLEHETATGTWVDHSNSVTNGITWRAVHAIEDGSAVVSGVGGHIERYDGQQWLAPLVMPSGQTVWDIRGSLDRLYIAAGDGLYLFDADGPGPELITEIGDLQMSLRSLDGVDGDMYFAGHNGTLGHTDGVMVTLIPDADSLGGEDLLGVTTTAWGDVFAVGWGPRAFRYRPGSGLEPEELEVPSNAGLTEIDSADGKLFVVGSKGRLLQWQGEGVVEQANLDSDNRRGMWGFGPDDVYSVGLAGNGADNGILHFDGTGWTKVAGTEDWSLNGVWGAASDDIWAVGQGGLVVHYDGSTWSEVTLPPNPLSPNDPLTTQTLHEIWGSSADDIWVVGNSETILRFDGSSWSALADMPAKAFGHDFVSIWGAGPDDVFVGNHKTRIFYWRGDDFALANGTGWDDAATYEPTDANNTIDIHGLFGYSRTHVVGVGEVGRVVRFNGSTWTEEASGTEADFRAVWGASAVDTYAVGESGLLMHYDGASWSPINTGVVQTIWGIWGTTPAPGDAPQVFVAESKGRMLDGSVELPRHGELGCASMVPLYCGSTVLGTLSQQPGSRMDQYGCGSAGSSGPDIFYRLVSPVDGDITISVTPHAVDMGLRVGDAHPSDDVCQGWSTCQGAGAPGGTTGATTLPSSQTDVDQVFWVSIDMLDSLATAGADLSYTLSVECLKASQSPPPVP